MYDRIDDAGVNLVARVVHGMLRDAIAAIDAPPFFLWPDGPSPDSAPFFFLRDYSVWRGEKRVRRGSGGTAFLTVLSNLFHRLLGFCRRPV